MRSSPDVMMRYSLPVRVLFGIVSGLVAGLIFGCAFGLIASCFRGGPSFTQGLIESAPFFALAFAVAGGMLALEGKASKS